MTSPSATVHGPVERRRARAGSFGASACLVAAALVAACPFPAAAQPAWRAGGQGSQPMGPPLGAMGVSPFRFGSVPPFRTTTSPGLSAADLGGAEAALLERPTGYASLAERLAGFQKLSRLLVKHARPDHPCSVFLSDVCLTFPHRFSVPATTGQGLAEDDFLSFDLIYLMLLRMGRFGLLGGAKLTGFELVPAGVLRHVVQELRRRPATAASLMTRQRLLFLVPELLPPELAGDEALARLRAGAQSLLFLPFDQQLVQMEALAGTLAETLAVKPTRGTTVSAGPSAPSTPATTPATTAATTPAVAARPAPEEPWLPGWLLLLATAALAAVGGRSLRARGPERPAPPAPAANDTSAEVTLPGFDPTAQANMFPDRYADVEFLGEGGMGCVFSARDRLLDRKVALKLLKPDANRRNPSSRARFLREAKALAKLRHPNIIGIYDVHDGDLPWFSMELLEGNSLDRLLAQGGPLPMERALELAQGLGRALACVHAASMVHRDVKPENVFFATEGVKLLDFGIAKPDATDITDTGQIVGTPRYLAPEVFFGHDAATARSDIYAVGHVLYVALTGKHPFESMALQSQRFEIKPPSLWREGLDRRWDGVVLDCLKFDPAERPADGAEFVRRLAVFDVADATSTGTLEALRALHGIHAAYLHALSGQLSVAERIEDQWPSVLDTLTRGSYIDTVGDLLTKLAERVKTLLGELGAPPPGPVADVVKLLSENLGTFERDVQELYRFGGEFFTVADELASAVGTAEDREARRRQLTRLTKQTLSRLHERYSGLSRTVKDCLRLQQVDFAVLLAKSLERRGDLQADLRVAPGEATVLVASPRGGAEDLAAIVDVLLDNAQQAGAKRVSWTCHERLEEQQIEVICEDDGGGLGEVEPKRLFEDGYTSKPGGSGTGLALARRLMSRHGGTIALGPRQGARGARVTLRFYVA